MELLQHELVIAQRRGQLKMKPQQQDPIPLSLAEANAQWELDLRSRAVSQLGQELWVLEKTSFKHGGFFVEFGATNGILLSNTYLIEKEFGWKGICAEPNPHFFKELQDNRSCQLSAACIGAKTGESVEFVFADVYGGMVKDALSDSHGPKRQAFQENGETAVLTTISLHDFLVTQDAPKNIDYLSIDTEGSEYSILETFPFERWNISLLTVEHNFTQQRAKIRSLLKSFGYQCHEANFDDWCYRE
jgi:FkbM family methyltransferase